MEDIRNKILKLTYDQCLKLIDPNSMLFRKLVPEADRESLLTTDEAIALSEGGRTLQYLQMGSCDLNNLEKITQTPAIFIANGTESLEIQGPNVELGIQVNNVGEIYPHVVRLIVNQGINPAYEESNPVVINKIHDQLNYLLDGSLYRALNADQFGYVFPSEVIRANIAAGYNLEGIVTPYEAYDFRVEVIFQRQLERIPT